MNAGTGMPGCTRVWNSPTISPPRTLTAPISVIPASDGDPPVVSRSTTTNVTSASGVPRSSNVGCSGRRRVEVVGLDASAPDRSGAGGPRAAPPGVGVGSAGLTSTTLGGGYDVAVEARRRRVVPIRPAAADALGPPDRGDRP